VKLDSLKAQLSRAIAKIDKYMMKGGVLLIDKDGYTYAPAMAAAYLAVTNKINLKDAFAIVKKANLCANWLRPVYEQLRPRITALTTKC